MELAGAVWLAGLWTVASVAIDIHSHDKKIGIILSKKMCFLSKIFVFQLIPSVFLSQQIRGSLGRTAPGLFDGSKFNILLANG